jgi:hypothetical protein
MARAKKRTCTNDKCAGPVVNHTVSEGSISRGVHTDTIVKENLVSVSRGVVYHSRSDAQRINNRLMPTNIVNKSCLYAPGHYTPQQCTQTSTEDNGKVDNNTNSIHVDDIEYKISFQKKNLYNKFECVMHSIKSWKHDAQDRALAVYIKGGIPFYRYRRECRRKRQPEILQWIICNGCQRGVCMQCANLVHQKIMKDLAIPTSLKHEHDWCQLVRKFRKIRPTDNQHVAVLNIPPIISHCCRLKQEVHYKRNQLKRLQKAQRKHGVTSDNSTINQSNDGLLHYAPYRVVLAPSTCFYETLCVAEQGGSGDPDHQEPVYHSVIPNQAAKDYDYRNVFPSG